jgi:hypothetical protein
MTTVSKSRTAKQSLPATPRQRGGRKAFAFRFWAAAVMLVPIGAAGLFVLITPALSPEKNPGPPPDTYRLGTIISDNGSVRCMHGTFDNTTGSVSENKPSCETTTFVDRGGSPTPVGTIRTLSAISDSFRK